ncbi:hypothetical protein ACIOEX_11010 [Streptomyces sp. NPDC087850]|uniref:hypothetical protein n=1 Tax=Streptomyces sp. NPDC087850 TaxID=3365809 RepID=UPI0038077391
MTDLNHRTEQELPARVCGARLHLADAYLAALMTLSAATAGGEEITADPRCSVEEHPATEPHWGIVQRRTAEEHPIWAQWCGGDQPRGFLTVECCTADTYGHGGCRLFRIHPGRCSFALTDPELTNGSWRPYRAPGGQ